MKSGVQQKSGPEQAGAPTAPVPFGKYLLLGSIGKGGMAEVFLARPYGQQHLLAIKVIRDRLSAQSEVVQMFVREGKLAVMLKHDAIVRTHEIGRIRGKHFICMEYISGVDLSVLLRRCQRGSRLPIPHAVFIVLRICEGLDYTHELKDERGQLLNVVNRDVSPSNIRLSFDGNVKLLDFGIAKAATGLSSEIGTLKGKISYMSPEQVRGLPLDRRSDVFSAGVVLHEVLTQEKMFRGESDFHLMDVVRRAEIRPPSLLNRRVPTELDHLVLKALQKNPADRFQTAGEMAAGLRGVLGSYRFQKPELGDLVREVCPDLWEKEQALLTACQISKTEDEVTPPAADAADDYGEFVVTLNDVQDKAPGAKLPAWVFALLVLAVALLLTAVVLLVAVG